MISYLVKIILVAVSFIITTTILYRFSNPYAGTVNKNVVHHPRYISVIVGSFFLYCLGVFLWFLVTANNEPTALIGAAGFSLFAMVMGAIFWSLRHSIIVWDEHGFEGPYTFRKRMYVSWDDVTGIAKRHVGTVTTIKTVNGNEVWLNPKMVGFAPFLLQLNNALKTLGHKPFTLKKPRER